jgi:hypothetical protein
MNPERITVSGSTITNISDGNERDFAIMEWKKGLPRELVINKKNIECYDVLCAFKI